MKKSNAITHEEAKKFLVLIRDMRKKEERYLSKFLTMFVKAKDYMAAVRTKSEISGMRQAYSNLEVAVKHSLEG